MTGSLFEVFEAWILYHTLLFIEGRLKDRAEEHWAGNEGRTWQNGFEVEDYVEIDEARRHSEYYSSFSHNTARLPTWNPPSRPGNESKMFPPLSFAQDFGLRSTVSSEAASFEEILRTCTNEDLVSRVNMRMLLLKLEVSEQKKREFRLPRVFRRRGASGIPIARSIATCFAGRRVPA